MNICQRVVQAAAAGDILISRHTHSIIANKVSSFTFQEHHVRCQGQEVACYQVLRRKNAKRLGKRDKTRPADRRQAPKATTPFAASTATTGEELADAKQVGGKYRAIAMTQLGRATPDGQFESDE